ncbi:MAG: zinc ribbon domain-containing protein [Candidatus Bathyarchaeia archaeon]
MTYCAKCGAENPEEAEYCFKCGTRLAPRARPTEEFAKRVERGAEELAETVRRGAEQCFGPPPSPPRRREEQDRVGIASFGFFLILMGGIYVITPNLPDLIVAFVRDFKLVEVASDIWFPTPASNHPELYGVAQQFCFAFGLFQTLILVVRFALGSTPRKKVDTVSGMIFWFGAGFLTWMLSTETIDWFNFLAGLIILVGLSIIVRALAPSEEGR